MLLSVRDWARCTPLCPLICIILVFGLRLARIGWRTLPKNCRPIPRQRRKKSGAVYFLVERKKKRSRAEYSTPKRIDFK